jgi:large subunit ribosomal protein L25
MATISLTAQPRTETGNGPARRLRAQGLVPGVLYQPPGASIAFSVPERDLRRALISEGGRDGVVELTIGDATPVQAVLVEWQRDPVRGDSRHVDFRPV